MQISFHSSTNKNYTVIYSLSLYNNHFFLPTAFLTSLYKNGQMGFILKKVHSQTIESYGLPLTPERKELFTIIEKLDIKALYKKFNALKKRPQPIEKLMEDREVKKVILQYIDKNLDTFLKLVKKYNFPLCWDAQKKTLADDLLCRFPKAILQPNFYFTKKDERVVYQLKMEEKGKEWTIHTKEVIPITNQPAWLFVDYKIYPVSHINGNLFKPFLKKDTVLIGQKHIKTYFQKFIVKIASKVNIEAKGFKVLTYNDIKDCQLQLSHNIFNQQLGIQLKFVYGKATFVWNERQQQKTILEFDTAEEIIIHQVKRNKKQEEIWMKKLLELGLNNEKSTLFQLAETEYQWALAEWLTKNKKTLEQANFAILSSALDQKRLYLHTPKMELSVQKNLDWFDIYGEVIVGKFSFPFLKLAKYIREQNPFYPLPDGTYFLIPEEWMHQYQGFFQLAKIKKDHLVVAKNQYVLLKKLDLELTEDETTNLDIDFEKIHYRPSSLLKAKLRPYQLQGVKWLIHHHREGFGACLADDMGLGKTLQTIALLLYAKEEQNLRKKPEKQQEAGGLQLGLFGGGREMDFYQPLQALIILPASLVFNWESEIRKFAPTLTNYRHVGSKRHKDIRLLKRFDVLLTTYQTALRDVKLLEKIEWAYIILDESQQIKNKDSKIFKAINQLQSEHRVSLSGTPVENSLSDLWSQMQFINPNMLGSFRSFKQNFITPIEKQQDEMTTERLRRLIAPFLLRRTKDLVAKDLPPLTEKVFYSEMSKEQRKLYEKEKSAARNYLLTRYNPKDLKYHSLVFQTLMKLRQMANHPVLVENDFERLSGKFEDVLEHLEVIHKGGHKVLLFSSFVKHLELFKQHFEKQGQAFSWLTGSTPSEQRVQNIQRFETDEKVQSFLISLKAGGTGLNLVAADYVFILDPWFNPATERQAIARAHRIGQQKQVIAIKFIAKDTIEEKILKLQEQKNKLVEDVIERSANARFSRSDIAFLLD